MVSGCHDCRVEGEKSSVLSLGALGASQGRFSGVLGAQAREDEVEEELRAEKVMATILECSQDQAGSSPGGQGRRKVIGFFFPPALLRYN